MRRVDMRKLHVCEIVKQSRIDACGVGDKNAQVVASTNNGWNYERNNEFGLFIKTPCGYKHVVTGVTYKTPSRETIDQKVVDPESIKEFVESEKRLAMFFYKRNKSYYLNYIEAAYIVLRINEEKQCEMHDKN